MNYFRCVYDQSWNCYLFTFILYDIIHSIHSEECRLKKLLWIWYETFYLFSTHCHETGVLLPKMMSFILMENMEYVIIGDEFFKWLIYESTLICCGVSHWTVWRVQIHKSTGPKIGISYRLYANRITKHNNGNHSMVHSNVCSIMPYSLVIITDDK